MPSIYLTCPRCNEEIEVLMEWESPDPYTFIGGGWYADGLVGHIACELTFKEDEDLSTAAEQRANTDAEFGNTVPDDESRYVPATSAGGAYTIYAGETKRQP